LPQFVPILVGFNYLPSRVPVLSTGRRIKGGKVPPLIQRLAPPPEVSLPVCPACFRQGFFID